MTNYEMVREFHDKFGCFKRDFLGNISSEEKTLRIRLMAEEFAELIAAMQLNDLPLVADALADLLYVVYGTATSYGVPMDAVFAEVHRSNMTKSNELDEGGKVTKGPNFELPELDEILTRKVE
jgi:predicted HAD superfamily Cof-like phosphohydrolase